MVNIQEFNSPKISCRKDVVEYLRIKAGLKNNVICFLDNKNRVFHHRTISNSFNLREDIFFQAIRYGSNEIIMYVKKRYDSNEFLENIEKESQLLHIKVIDTIFY